MKARLLLYPIVLLAFPAAATAQVQLEAAAYARARAQCGYRYQEQVRLRCGDSTAGTSAGSCSVPYLAQQEQCLRRAEQSYVRALQRRLRQHY